MTFTKNQTSNSKGFSHVIIPLLVVALVGIVGVYLMVSGHAQVSDGGYRKPGKINPYTALCPGNTIKYRVAKDNTATRAARTRVFGSPTTATTTANLTTVNFMGKAVVVNKKIENCLKAVEWDLQFKYHTKYKLNVIYGSAQEGGENTFTRFHAYGGAVDINPQQNPYYDKPCKGGCPHDIPTAWVKAFKAHGFYWGGNYSTIKDYMHFEWHGEI